jgi:hypothetical protein
MKKQLPMLGLIVLMTFVAVAIFVGCRQDAARPNAQEAKGAPGGVPPLSPLLEELAPDPPLRDNIVKKPIEFVKVEVAIPEPPPNFSALKLQLAESVARKERCQYAVAYSKRVARYVQQHEEDFIANWSILGSRWGPIEPILAAYRQLKIDCQKKVEGDQAELQQAIVQWRKVDAQLRQLQTPAP